jgi:hypothetical protein|nr:MAG TPA: hypothetical protein [Caudoviricetes sp.]
MRTVSMDAEKRPVIRRDAETGIALHKTSRDERTVEIMFKEIDSIERRVSALHLTPPWNDTVLGGAIGVTTSAGFGLISLYQSDNVPLWTLLVSWGLLFAGVTATVLCLFFKREFSDVEQSQKRQLIEDMEQWKGNQDFSIKGREFVDSLMKEYGDAKVSDLQRILRL